MKGYQLAIFLIIIITVHLASNYYIFIHGWHALPEESTIRYYYLGVYIFLVLSFIGARLLDNLVPNIISDFLGWVGSIWMGAMLYFFIIILLLDIIRVINHFFSIYPVWVTNNYDSTKIYLLISSICVVAVILIYGFINARFPATREISIKIEKKSDKLKSVHVAFATDIHLGNMLGRHFFENIVDKLNSLNPDIIILGGDIFDEKLHRVISDGMGDLFEKLHAPMGVYAVTGNHEYFGGVEEAVNFMRQHGIKVLRDTSILIDSSFYLIGREDKQRNMMTDNRRKSLSELLKTCDSNKPIIVLDHQPGSIKESVSNNIDIQLSGHTHNGQLWPISLITSLVYEISSGYGRFDNTQIYVSNGVGTWGPPFRIGHRPEIVDLVVEFE